MIDTLVLLAKMLPGRPTVRFLRQLSQIQKCGVGRTKIAPNFRPTGRLGAGR
jgi:hypothetical protein